MIARLLPALFALPLTVMAATAPHPAPKVLVEVDGTPINELHFLVYRAQQGKGHESQDPAAQMSLLNQLINTALVANQAKAKKLDQHPEIVAALEMARMSILAEAVAQDYLKNNPVSDEAIAAAYAEKYKPEGKSEYKARHILLKTEDDAKAVIEALDGGADFATLAKEKSTGPSGPSGGDLGWFSPGQMVKPFADATVALKKGAHSKTPVKTQFGWHVIMLEDVREVQPPKLEEVKDQLRREINRNSLGKYLADLRAKAKIEFNSAKPAEAEPATEKK